MWAYISAIKSVVIKFWKITTWNVCNSNKYEQLLRNFWEMFWPSVCSLKPFHNMNGTSTSVNSRTFNYGKGQRTDFSWNEGWPTSMVQIIKHFKVGGKIKCKTGLKSAVCANRAEEKGGLQVWMEYKMGFNRPVTQNSPIDAKHFNGLSLEGK